MTEDCWQCAESCNWYTDDCEDYTEYEGQRYHDDYIPAHIADATAEEEAAPAVAERDIELEQALAIISKITVTTDDNMDARFAFAA